MHPSFDSPLEFVEGIANILILENKKLRVELIEELLLQAETGEGTFVLSEEESILRMDKTAHLIIDPFSLDVNQKKVLSKIQLTLKELASDENNYMESMRIVGELTSYFEGLADQVDYPLSFKDPLDLQDLIKLSGAKVETSEASFFENLWNYVSLINSVLGTPLFIFVNLGLFVQEEELQELYKISNYKKIHLLFIESLDLRSHTLFERITIIDNDLCVIKNF